MTEHNHAWNVDLVILQIREQLSNIEKRLDALEAHRKRGAKLAEIQARQVERDMAPEHRAEVERRVNDMMKELENDG